ncbi:hypothetical protein EXS66_02765 [Candidatus Saccharibacteria bacterium]|nr:hypothetical protein [Candidatus Saccharibacteria bacterium]
MIDLVLIKKAYAVSLIGNLDTNKIFSRDGLIGIIPNIFQLVSYTTGIVSVIFVIVGGIMLSTAAGNESQIVKGRSTILWAIVGLLLSIASIGITTFIVQSLGGSVN